MQFLLSKGCSSLVVLVELGPPLRREYLRLRGRVESITTRLPVLDFSSKVCARYQPQFCPLLDFPSCIGSSEKFLLVRRLLPVTDRLA